VSAIARGVAAGTAQTAIALLAGPVMTAVVVRTLSTSDAAFWFVVLSLSTYFALFDLGLGPSLSRHVAFALGTDLQRGAWGASSEARLDEATASRIADEYCTAAWINAGIVGALLTTGLILMPAALSAVSEIPFDASRTRACRLFVFGCAANLLASPRLALAAGLGNVAGPRWCRAGAQLVGVACALGALWAGAGLPVVAGAWLLQNLVLLVTAYVMVRTSTLRTAGLRGSYRPALARAFIRPSLRWASMNVGAVFILASGPIIIAREAGIHYVAGFVALRQLGEAMYLLAIIPAQASEPFTSMLAAAGQWDRVVTLLQRNSRHVASLILAGAAVLLTFGGDVTTVWVGSENFAGPLSLVLATTFFALECHHVVHASTLMATGDIPFIISAGIGGMLTIAFGIPLSRQYGVSGMLAAMVAAQLMTNNWYAPWITLRRLGVGARQYVGWLRPAFSSGLVMFGGVSVIRLLVDEMLGVRTLMGIATALMLSLCLLLVVAWYVALTLTERQWVVQRLQAATAGQV
jgi:hypothetical protein